MHFKYGQIADHFKDPKDCFVEVVNQVFVPNKTMWADLIALCDEAGFEKMSNDLLEAYRTGQYVYIVVQHIYVHVCETSLAYTYMHSLHPPYRCSSCEGRR